MPDDNINEKKILDDVTTTATGTAVEPYGPKMSFQSQGSVSASTGSATILIEVSNDNTNWITMSTHTLSLTTTESASVVGSTADASWNKVRARVSAISGTNATVSTWIGMHRK